MGVRLLAVLQMGLCKVVMALLMLLLLLQAMRPSKVGGGGRVGEVSSTAALGIDRPVVWHRLALWERGRRRRRGTPSDMQRFAVVFLLGAGAAAAQSEHGAEIPQQLV